MRIKSALNHDQFAYRAMDFLQLAGKTIVRFESAFPALNRIDDDHPLIGRTVESVSSRGKHLLMTVSGDLVLRTHMRMNGSWHIYRPGERWRRPAREMRVLVAQLNNVETQLSPDDLYAMRTQGPLALRRQLQAQLVGGWFHAESIAQRMNYIDHDAPQSSAAAP